jgi:hypothetical protein
MTDEELRAVTEDLHDLDGPWATEPSGQLAGYTAVRQGRHIIVAHCFREEVAAFIAAASPDVVLGLLDRATNAEKDFHDAMELVRKYSAERDETREAVRRLPRHTAVTEAEAAPNPALPETGAPFGGGYYVDTITDNGQTYALVVAPKEDEAGAMTWKQAGKHAATCRAGGHDDWQLPSRRDALALAEKLLPAGRETPDAFREGGGQDFDRSWYWTGAEVDGAPGYAWVQLFDYGGQDSYVKDGSNRVRAVRRIVMGAL